MNLKFRTSREFSAAHHISTHKGKCSNVHGHTWKVDVEVTFFEVIPSKILLDFGEVKSIIDNLDHTDLNEALEVADVTAEYLTGYFYNEIAFLVRKNGYTGKYSLLIRVWESKDSYIEGTD